MGIFSDASENDYYRMKEERDKAYHERNQLVSFFSKLYPSHLAKHPSSDLTWERDWMNIVCIHTPEGQLSWHIHDNELPLFDHLNFAPNDWDGHTTDAKYERLDFLGKRLFKELIKRKETKV